MVLSADEVETYRRDGYIYLQQISTPDEVLEIREILADLFARKVGVKEGAQFDLLNPDSTDSMTLGQLTNPCDFAPRLRKTEYVKKAHDLAKQLLGPRALRSADFVLMKPARTGSATPWHQDQAYRNASYTARELSIWMPLQDVDENSGCMQFVPGTQLYPIKPHRSPNNDLRSHSLECCEIPPPEKVVSVPMRAGDCSIHDNRVLHGTPANRSEVTRFAYILVFQEPVVTTEAPVPYLWLLEKVNVNRKRHEAWFRRGGFLIVAWHKFRRGDLSSIDGIKLALQRGIMHFWKKKRSQT
jgi:Phytanoyl-CoA dioxygenase (PhyH)